MGCCDDKPTFSGSTDYSTIVGNSELQNITILDARKHNPGPFSQAGFTLIKLDEVSLGQNRFLSISVLNPPRNLIIEIKEPITTNWRAGSEDIHVFQEQMTPYLKQMYPQTKVKSRHNFSCCGLF